MFFLSSFVSFYYINLVFLIMFLYSAFLLLPIDGIRKISTIIDVYRWSLIILSLIIRVLILQVFLATESNEINFSRIVINLIILILLFFFISESFLIFYLFFELRLLPIFFMVLGIGTQPERFVSGFYLLLYTARASLPLLFRIIWMTNNSLFSVFLLILIAIRIKPRVYLFIFVVSCSLAFLVKFPLFFFHIWLPKAHVEAPVYGSMILAGILLKLGGFGLIFFSPILLIIISFIKFIQIFRLLGGLLSSFICLSQKDIKVLIAYSSVCHMAIVIRSLLRFKAIAMISGLIMLVAHGISSSGLFFLSFVPYKYANSRRMYLVKSLLSVVPIFVFMFFIVCLRNMRGPFTLNLLREVFILRVIVNSINFSILPIFLIRLVSIAYSIILYVYVSCGQDSGNKKFIFSFIEVFLSVRFFHVVYSFFMLYLRNVFLN